MAVSPICPTRPHTCWLSLWIMRYNHIYLSFRRIRTANVIVWYKVLNITKIVAKLFGCFDFI